MAKTKTMKSKIKNLRNQVKDKYYELDEKARETVGDNPYESVAIAFGVGLLAGMGLAYLMRRK